MDFTPVPGCAAPGPLRREGAPVNAASRREFRCRDDVVISYQVEGEGAIPVVFLHGFAAALTTWDDIRPLFPPGLCRLYCLDLKGFGRSSKPRDGAYGPADQAAVISAFLEDRQLRKAVLVGHSLGGGIALLTLLQAEAAGKGDLIGGLVLIDSAAYPQRLPPVLGLIRLPLLGWAILHLLPVSVMVRFTLLKIYHDRRTMTPARIARYTDSFNRKGIAQVFIETVRRLIPDDFPRIIASYRTIAAPVLAIWGREDPIILLEKGVRLNRDIPGSRLVVIDACGHNPHEEKPAATCAAIVEFLDRFFT